jgi:hypothetical protein
MRSNFSRLSCCDKPTVKSLTALRQKEALDTYLPSRLGTLTLMLT